jgi:hypothetical protein
VNRHFEMSGVICPHCDHEFSADDMNAAEAEDDLWDIAPSEGQTECKCVACGKQFFVQGGYVPLWTTAIDQDDL